MYKVVKIIIEDLTKRLRDEGCENILSSPKNKYR